jgi:hypothetical protein
VKLSGFVSHAVLLPPSAAEINIRAIDTGTTRLAQTVEVFRRTVF